MAKLRDVNLTVSVRVQPAARIAAVVITLLDRHVSSYEVERVLRTVAAYFNFTIQKG